MNFVQFFTNFKNKSLIKFLRFLSSFNNSLRVILNDNRFVSPTTFNRFKQFYIVENNK